MMTSPNLLRLGRSCAKWRNGVLLVATLFLLAGGAFASPGNAGMARLGPKPAPSVVAPGGVTTLRADAVTDTSVVLSWVEVSSGTTAIARYVIRAAPVAAQPFTWGSAADVVSGGCAAPVYGSTAAGGRTRSCVLTGLRANTGYDVQLVAYTGVLNSNAVFGPFSNLIHVTTAQRVGPMLVVRPRMLLDTATIQAASITDYGTARFPLRGTFPLGDRIALFYDSTGALVARGYVLITRP